MTPDITSDRTVARLVGGRYRITGLIASGGMGEVYAARDTVLDRTVALKVLRPQLGSDEAFVDRFRREAMAAAQLTHPSIVQVYDWGRDASDAYMAMEFVDGENLREILAARGRLAPEVAARIAWQVCTALETARRAGIVHRDIKPENILITPGGDVKVADFGLARALAESTATQAGIVLGTAAYLSPEQVQGTEVDHRTDVYALGIVLYEMLVGRPPFTADSPAAVAVRRVNEDVPAPNVSPSLDRIVARATARRREDRFVSAAEMGAALRDAVPSTAFTGDLSLVVQHTTAIPVETMPTVQLDRKPPRMRFKWKRMALVLALLAIAGTAIPIGLRAASRVKVPSVDGMTRDRAFTTLKDAGLDPTAERVNDDAVPEGNVIRTDPPAGAGAHRGDKITVFVSAGPEIVDILDVKGKTLQDATRLLTELGLKVVSVEVFNVAKKGTVVGQKPDAPAVVRKGTQVTLTVSKGPEMIVVPDVRNKSEADATKVLTDAGFTVRVTKQQSELVLEGNVISQTPAGGQKAAKGSAITLVVSSGTPLAPVPDLRCKTRRQAQDALAAAGFKAEFKGEGRYVVDQNPAPGTEAHKGSTVTAYMGSGVFLGC